MCFAHKRNQQTSLALPNSLINPGWNAGQYVFKTQCVAAKHVQYVQTLQTCPEANTTVGTAKTQTLIHEILLVAMLLQCQKQHGNALILPTQAHCGKATPFHSGAVLLVFSTSVLSMAEEML